MGEAEADVLAFMSPRRITGQKSIEPDGGFARPTEVKLAPAGQSHHASYNSTHIQFFIRSSWWGKICLI
jgi:hypothetical protein